ncbi:MAG: HyaD/HybD family hydrogenase maturation endopeptidase [Deltaproteobacteria bacterium]|nr:HyaD/HybD family hydrogenase maturation endopeptidase [Deltaproteobacteria bacterium]
MLGIGNILRRDEGIGVRALEAFQAAFILPNGVKCVDGGVAGLNLLPVIAGFDRLIIIDALATGAPPGTISRLAWADVKDAPGLGGSAHRIGIKELLALAEFEGSCPAAIIIGTPPADISPGERMTDLIEGAVPAIVEAIRRELERSGFKLEKRRHDARGTSDADDSGGNKKGTARDERAKAHDRNVKTRRGKRGKA